MKRFIKFSLTLLMMILVFSSTTFADEIKSTSMELYKQGDQVYFDYNVVDGDNLISIGFTKNEKLVGKDISRNKYFIMKRDVSGNIIWFSTVPETLGVNNHFDSINYWQNLIVAEDGYLMIYEANDILTLMKYSKDGKLLYQTPIELNDKVFNKKNIFIDKSKNINIYTTNILFKFTPKGKFLEKIEFDSYKCFSLALSPKNEIYSIISQNEEYYISQLDSSFEIKKKNKIDLSKASIADCQLSIDRNLNFVFLDQKINVSGTIHRDFGYYSDFMDASSLFSLFINESTLESTLLTIDGDYDDHFKTSFIRNDSLVILGVSDSPQFSSNGEGSLFGVSVDLKDKKISSYHILNSDPLNKEKITPMSNTDMDVFIIDDKLLNQITLEAILREQHFDNISILQKEYLLEDFIKHSFNNPREKKESTSRMTEIIAEWEFYPCEWLLNESINDLQTEVYNSLKKTSSSNYFDNFSRINKYQYQKRYPFYSSFDIYLLHSDLEEYTTTPYGKELIKKIDFPIIVLDNYLEEYDISIAQNSFELAEEASYYEVHIDDLFFKITPEHLALLPTKSKLRILVSNTIDDIKKYGPMTFTPNKFRFFINDEEISELPFEIQVSLAKSDDYSNPLDLSNSIVLFNNKKLSSSNTGSFKVKKSGVYQLKLLEDVSINDLYLIKDEQYYFIHQLISSDIIESPVNGRFNPDSTISSGEFARILYENFKVDKSTDLLNNKNTLTVQSSIPIIADILTKKGQSITDEMASTYYATEFIKSLPDDMKKQGALLEAKYITYNPIYWKPLNSQISKLEMIKIILTLKDTIN